MSAWWRDAGFDATPFYADRADTYLSRPGSRHEQIVSDVEARERGAGCDAISPSQGRPIRTRPGLGAGQIESTGPRQRRSVPDDQARGETRS